MEENGCICRAERLTKVYGNLRAVDGVSFCVKPGEIFGYLGPNGAGKTTTVRMLTGLTRITSGRAWIDGYDVERDPLHAKAAMGLVPDSSNLYSELTCWENLMFHGEMYGVPRSERAERDRALLRFFGLEKFRDVKFQALSKGLKRRLTIAAALMHNPRLLFLDEPTIGLDVLGRRRVWSLLKKLNREGLTIFLTTHNIYEAFELCDRIAVINRGRLVAVGTPSELKSRFSASEVLEVSFYPRNPPIGELSRLAAVAHADEAGSYVKLVVSDSLRALRSLLDYAEGRGLRIETLSLRGADAEEVFLKIIGEGEAR